MPIVRRSTWKTVRRWLGAAVFGVHGLIHLLSYLAVWSLVELSGLSNTPSLYLTGRPVTDPLVRGFATVWLVAGLLFVGAAVVTAKQGSWPRGLSALAASLSLVPTLLWWMDAGWGFFVSLSILLVACCSGRATVPLTPNEIADRDFGRELTRYGA